MYSPYGTKRATKSGPVEVVSTLQDDHPALSRNLLRELQAERAKHYEALISAKDWADFERRRGHIVGLETAIALCEQAKDKLNQ